MGSPAGETERTNETLHKQRIDRRFAIAAKPITKSEFLLFALYYKGKSIGADAKGIAPYMLSGDSPMIAMTWYEAAWYCNWLSQMEGVDKSQWCYEPNEKGEYAKGLRPANDYLQRRGYRLPTEAEWEYACRSGAVTSRYYGASPELLSKYAWYQEKPDSPQHTFPVGMKKPNDFGLFDMHGNVWQWCDNRCEDYATNGAEMKDLGMRTAVGDDADRRVLRGGSFNNQASFVRSASRNYDVPTIRNVNNGFRAARTYP